jgi:hypothetical protein
VPSYALPRQGEHLMPPDRNLRVALVSETALTAVNGVTNSVLKTVDHLRTAGHDALVVAPGPTPYAAAGFTVHSCPNLPAAGLPVVPGGYRHRDHQPAR